MEDSKSMFCLELKFWGQTKFMVVGQDKKKKTFIYTKKQTGNF